MPPAAVAGDGEGPASRETGSREVVPYTAAGTENPNVQTRDVDKALRILWAPLPPGKSVYDRLGQFGGLLMQQQVDKYFRKFPGQTVALQYFDSD
eukprot:864120-Pyramimonas_sp.AAC.1